MNRSRTQFFACAGLLALALLSPPGAHAAWPTDPAVNVPLCTASGIQEDPVAVSDGAGGAIVAWHDWRNGNMDIYAQRVLASGVVDPAWPADGRALCTNGSHQLYPTITSDGQGGAIVTWWDRRGSTGTDIYAQHVLASGSVDPAWPANGRALCTAVLDQYYPTIASDGAGGAIVTWWDIRRTGSAYYSDIYAQHVLASGMVDPAWPVDGRVVCAAFYDQAYPRIVPDGAGGAIITWQDWRSPTKPDVYAQRVLASGVVDPAWPADGRAVCTALGEQRYPMLVSDGAGGAIVTWQDGRGGSSDIYAQRVLSSGAADPAWPVDGRAVCSATLDQIDPRIASDGAGGAIVTWADARNSATQFDIYVQHLLATGVADPAWPLDGRAACTAATQQTSAEIVADGLGGAIVVWQDGRNGLPDVYAQHVLAAGEVAPGWPLDGRAVCTAADWQWRPQIVSDGEGSTVIAWQDSRNGGHPASSDIYAQAFPREVSFVDAGAGLPGVYGGFGTWGDYDDDGDLDLAMMGFTGGDYISRIFRNDGGTFVDANAGLAGVYSGWLAWGDYDNDGDLDLLLTGYTGSGGTTRVYRNDGGAFVDINAGLTAAHSTSGAWGDYDNDGDLDLAVMGYVGPGDVRAWLYRNDGGGSFTSVASGLAGASGGSFEWGDYDNDGDLDLAQTGYRAAGAYLSRVYRNDGGAAFTSINAGLTPAYGGVLSWGDYDNDGDLDLLLTGRAVSSNVAQVYRNDGGAFTNINAGLRGAEGAGAWGDFDNDGDLDIVVAGRTGSGDLSLLYRNDGGGTFTEVVAGLPGVYGSWVSWGDFDGDGDLDMVLMGSGSGGNLSRIYRSHGAAPNTPPAAPGGLAAQVNAGTLTLSWNAATDAQTPSAGLSYNLRIGSTPGGNEIGAAMARESDGFRRVVQLGNAQKRTSWGVRLPGSWTAVFWSVQAVDAAHAGSPFAPERTCTQTPFGAMPVCSAPGDQLAPRLLSDGHGGALVAWVDGRGGSSDIHAQHVLARFALDPAWPPEGVPVCTAPGEQANLRMISDGAGGAILAWEDARAGDSDIYAHHVLASGALDPRWPPNGLALSAAGEQRHPSLDVDDLGGAIVAWDDEQGTSVVVRHVLASGVVDEAWPAGGVSVPVTFTPCFPHVVADGQRGALVLFSSGSEHVTATGALDPAWQPELFPGSWWQDGVAAASDAAGGAYVLWGDVSFGHLLGTGASGPGSYSRWLRSVGATSFAIDVDGAGGAVAAYTVPPPNSPGGMHQEGIYALLVRASGDIAHWALTPPYPPPPPGVTSECGIAADAAGGALVVWTDDRDGGHPEIFLQHVTSSGAPDPTCPELGRSLSAWTSHAARAAQIVGDRAGGGIVAWQGQRGDGTWDIYAARIWGDTPTAALATFVSAEATAERVRLEWYWGSGAGLLATIYRRTDATDWRPVGTASPDGAGRLVFLDHDVAGGTRYGYRLGITTDGREVFQGETWLATPTHAVLALKGLQPNPARGSASVAFSLPDDRAAHLAVLDVSGRRVLEKRLGALGPGSHVLRLDGTQPLPAGLYFIQLTHGGRVLTTRGVIVR